MRVFQSQSFEGVGPDEIGEFSYPALDMTAQTLGMLMGGREVNQIDEEFEAELTRLRIHLRKLLRSTSRLGLSHGPESNAGFLALARLEKEKVPVFRAMTREPKNSRIRGWAVRSPMGCAARHFLFTRLPRG